jgi:hypothetical protein
LIGHVSLVTAVVLRVIWLLFHFVVKQSPPQ